MTNDLVTTNQFDLPLDPDAVDIEVLKAAMGVADDDQLGNNLPRLSIEYDSEYIDEDAEEAAKAAGKKYKPEPLPRSHYKITFQTDWDAEEPSGDYVTAYAEEAEFLPIVITNRYQIFNLEEEKMVLSTELYRNWEQTIVDDNGGEQSARSYKKKMLPKYQHLVKEDRDFRCKNALFGLLTMKSAVDRHGKKVKVKDVPCEWYTHGASFMPVAEALTEIKKRGLLPCNRVMQLTTGREKNGTNTYFPVQVEWGTKHIDISPEIMQLTIDFGATVDAENDAIRAKFEAKHAKNEAEALAATVIDQSLDDDLDDEIPF
jgi:hypothetical protein|tara:strand:+ start:5419 stop:6366 length:948 start_codon:yes stop_codon:yes gene_type:complete